MKILRLTVGLNVSSPKKFFGGLWGLKRKNIILLKFTSYFIKQAVSELLYINWNYLRLLILPIFFRINDKHNDVQKKKKFKVIFEVINSKITKNHYTKNKWTFLEIYTKIKKFSPADFKKKPNSSKTYVLTHCFGSISPQGAFWPLLRAGLMTLWLGLFASVEEAMVPDRFTSSAAFCTISSY